MRMLSQHTHGKRKALAAKGVAADADRGVTLVSAVQADWTPSTRRGCGVERQAASGHVASRAPAHARCSRATNRSTDIPTPRVRDCAAPRASYRVSRGVPTMLGMLSATCSRELLARKRSAGWARRTARRFRELFRRHPPRPSSERPSKADSRAVLPTFSGDRAEAVPTQRPLADRPYSGAMSGLQRGVSELTEGDADAS